MDSFLFHFFNQWAGQWLCLDALAIFLAKYFGYFLICSLFGWLAGDFLFSRRLSKKDAGFKKERFLKTVKIISLSLGAALFSRLIITEIIRWLYYRPRPFLAEEVNQLISHSASGSFPSGHAAFYFALSTVIYLGFKKVYPASKFGRGIGLIFFGASFLISLARVFAGLHYPSDILAGALIGIFFGWLTNKLFSKGKSTES